jgi:ferredoxin
VADPEERWEDNSGGAWFVDKTCILCSMCSELAPANFCESEDGDHDVCYKQPVSDQERRQCQEALEQCPVEAIGKNGRPAS